MPERQDISNEASADDRLVSLVAAHYAHPPLAPLLLSQLGIQARAAGIVDGGQGSGQLTTLIRNIGLNRLVIVCPGEDKARSAVALPSNANEVKQLLGNVSVYNAEAQRFIGLPRALQVAFCVRTDPGEAVSVTTSLPFRYEKFKANMQPGSGHVVIDEEFRKPGLRLQDASNEKKAALWQCFQRWAESKEISTEPFLQVRPVAEVRHGIADSHPTAFSRLLQAQSIEIRGKLVFPADIVEILLRHS